MKIRTLLDSSTKKHLMTLAFIIEKNNFFCHYIMSSSGQRWRKWAKNSISFLYHVNNEKWLTKKFFFYSQEKLKSYIFKKMKTTFLVNNFLNVINIILHANYFCIIRNHNFLRNWKQRLLGSIFIGGKKSLLKLFSLSCYKKVSINTSY